MATIEIFSNKTSGGGGGGGNLQMAGGVDITTTLVAVTDTNGNASTLRLSTLLAQFLSTLRITTNDEIYLDIEDGTTNNRFTISRPASGQKIALDFASNPTGSTTIVGSIRTYVDGVNLSDVMTFREDGLIEIFNLLCFGGTTSSFPAIKRNGTNIDFRLANDSAFTQINASIFQVGGSGTQLQINQLLLGGYNVMQLSTRLYIDGDNRGVAINNNLSIGGGNVSADASSVLDLISTTKGFLPPRMTNAQKNAITSPANGLIVHDTTNNGVAYYDGSTWGYLSGAKQTLTGSGGTLNIGFRNGNIVDLTLNASTTLTFASHVVGTFIIQVTQGGVGSNTLTYPASVKWSGGTAPTLTTAVGKTDILTFYHDGTSFFGTYSLNY